MSTAKRYVIAACIMLLVLPALTYAQRSTGDIVGNIKDASGGVLPRVKVTVTNVGTGLVRTVSTNEVGDYVVASLPVGEYSVAAELQGFTTATVTGLALQFDQRARVDVVLKVGSVQETVSVEGLAPIIETDTSTVGQVMVTHVIDSLPLNKRDYLSLTLLTPGVVPAEQGSIVAFFRGAVQANGAREEANNFTLDGVQNKDNMIHGIVVQPSLDAIQEFKVQSSTYSAEYGHGGGAQINIITKSGTNSFHGTGFEFHRSDKFDARNFFANPGEATPQFRMNQFGGSLGGPIKRNRTFFFVNVERRRLAQETPKLATVPTEAMRGGDFSGLAPIYDPQTFDPATGSAQPFAGNVIPTNRIDPIASQIVALLPLPNRAGGLNFVSTPNFSDDMDTATVRVDHHLSKDNSLAARWSYYRGLRFSPHGRFNDRDLPGYGDDFDAHNHNVMASWTSVIGSNKVNELKFGFAGLKEGFLAQNRNIDYVGQLGITGLPTDPSMFGMPQFFITGIGSFGDGCCFPQIRWDRKYEFIDNLAITRGNHAFKVGGDFTYYHQQMYLHIRELFNFSPNFTRDPQNTDPAATGNGFADFLLGYPTSAGRNTGLQEGNLRKKFYQFYFLDDWNVLPKLTLNLGVRYEYQTPFVDIHDFRASFDPVTGQQIYPNNPPGTPRSLYDADKTNVAPRVGMAWRFADRTVMRAGYGIYYTLENGDGQDGLYRAEPFQHNQTFIAQPNVPNLTLHDPYPAAALSAGAVNIVGIDRHFPVGRYHQWSLNLQRELAKQLSVEVGYVGSKGVNLQGEREINQAVPGPGPLQSRRPYPQFGSIQMYEAIYPSNYNALQSKVQWRFSGASSLLATYTFSKAIDIQSSFYAVYVNSNIQDWHNLDAARGLANFDRRHTLTVSFVAELPFGKGKRFLSEGGVVSAIFGNWQVNSIAQVASGNPVTVILASDNSNTSSFTDWPDLVGNPVPSHQGPNQWINPAAFQVPAPFTFGNQGRNKIIGPGINRIDLSLFKLVPLYKEKLKVELRLEAFNALNHPNFYQPNKVFGTPQFGQIAQAYDGRDVQFGVRFMF